jgi:hypothetical protein
MSTDLPVIDRFFLLGGDSEHNSDETSKGKKTEGYILRSTKYTRCQGPKGGGGCGARPTDQCNTIVNLSQGCQPNAHRILLKESTLYYLNCEQQLQADRVHTKYKSMPLSSM